MKPYNALYSKKELRNFLKSKKRIDERAKQNDLFIKEQRRAKEVGISFNHIGRLPL